MCGFVGFLGGVAAGGEADERALLQRMADTIAHRGPDDAGYWSDPGQRIGLAHRRLAIVDLSAAGHQPMATANGRHVLIFNGEIYNHLRLRAELEQEGKAPAWRGHSDTETLCAGVEAWGIEATLRRAIGMFAFALWDRQTQQLTLGRDRLGEKPLYYGWQGEGRQAVLLFGSELKALRAHPAFAHRIDRGALALQMRHNYIPAPHAIYEGIRKLPPACLLTLSLAARDAAPQPYWSAAEVARRGVQAPLQDNPQGAVDQLEALLKEAVGQQMVADVPLGAFLSGGIDSSTVVALMQAQSARPVKTFTIGFHEAGFNEAEHASAVARHLGTEHTELYVSAAQALAVVPRLPAMYDEPFSDASQIPTFLVAQLARAHVTVSLSGDAGDELFCGYQRYAMTAAMWRRIAPLPMPLRRLGAGALKALPVGAWNALAGVAAPLLPRSRRAVNWGDKLHKGAEVLGSASCADLYRNLVSHMHDPGDLVLGAREPATLLTHDPDSSTGLSDIERMMALDLRTYLPDDILVKVDRASMAVSLESRVPFLDHRVVEFAWRLPQSLKVRDGQAKWALRQVLYRHVPPALIDRPKMGFGVPIGAWLRGPLRDWAAALVEPARLRREGYFDAVRVERLWEEHQSGSRNWQTRLWNILMFQAWLESQSQPATFITSR